MRPEREQPLPWQKPIWERLASTLRNDRLGHGILLAGPPDIGKLRLARVLAMSLLCLRNQPGDQACGECSSCIQFIAETHPDYAVLEPDGAADVISVDNVRELCRQLQFTSHHGRGRIGVIDRCERMTIAASNSLLKTLEEPPISSRLVLITHRPMGLPATIRSRCRLLRLPLPDQISVKAWLAEQDLDKETAATLTQRPLLALKQDASDLKAVAPYVKEAIALACYQEDASVIAEKWAAQEPVAASEALYFCLLDMLRLNAVNKAAELTNGAHAGSLKKLAASISGQRLNFLVHSVIHARSLIGTQANQQLLLESLLLQWQTSWPRSVVPSK